MTIFKNPDDLPPALGKLAHGEICCPWCGKEFCTDMRYMIEEPVCDACPNCGGLIDVLHECDDDGCSEWAEKRD